MAERAAHLVDHVLADVPIRHWVLSLPYPLRYLLAWDHGGRILSGSPGHSSRRLHWPTNCLRRPRPGNNESAGKHKTGKTRKGNRWLRALLVECALAAIRTKDAPLGVRYRRVMRHRGHKKAVVAVAHALLRTICQVLASDQEYRNLGPDYYDRRDTDRVRRRAVQTLERLGFRVTIEAAA